MTLPMSGRESCSAGEMPNAIAVAAAKPRLKSSTGRFISITDSAGKELDGSQAAINTRARQANNTPNAPPAKAMASDSVSSCRTIRPRAAARAERTASSCCRCAPRASNRMETLAHPMNQQRRDRAKQQVECRPHGLGIKIRNAAQFHAETVRVAGRAVSRTVRRGAAVRRSPGRRLPGTNFQGPSQINIRVERDLERQVDLRLAPAENAAASRPRSGKVLCTSWMLRPTMAGSPLKHRCQNR